MRTTLNIPDALVAEAKRRALDEGTTMTDILVQGLAERLEKSLPVPDLPVSRATGGLVRGTAWDRLEAQGQGAGLYR